MKEYIKSAAKEQRMWPHRGNSQPPHLKKWALNGTRFHDSLQQSRPPKHCNPNHLAKKSNRSQLQGQKSVRQEDKRRVSHSKNCRFVAADSSVRSCREYSDRTLRKRRGYIKRGLCINRPLKISVRKFSRS